jgi:hypothetical protein
MIALDDMSEKEASTLLNQIESADEELFLLRKKFSKDLKAVLPAVKIIKLRKSEEGFNRKLCINTEVQKNNTLQSYNPIPCITA